MHSGEYNGMVNLYAFSASDAVGPAFKGDMVCADATYNGTELTDSYAPGIPCVSAKVAAFTTGFSRGVIAGFVPDPEYNMTVSASLGLMYRPVSTKRFVWVVDDYLTIFEGQQILNSWTTGTTNMINSSADIDYTAGSTITGISGVQVAASSTGHLPLRILRLTQRVDNFNSTAADASAYFKVDVYNMSSDLGLGAVAVGA
jgi:hypothetical protein